MAQLVETQKKLRKVYSESARALLRGTQRNHLTIAMAFNHDNDKISIRKYIMQVSFEHTAMKFKILHAVQYKLTNCRLVSMSFNVPSSWQTRISLH